jgi:hypothetical protein
MRFFYKDQSLNAAQEFHNISFRLDLDLPGCLLPLGFLQVFKDQERKGKEMEL